MQQSIEDDDLIDLIESIKERLRQASQRLRPADRDADTVVALVLAELDPDKKSPTDVRLLAHCTLMRLAFGMRGVERLPKLWPQDDDA
jgi:hypothetical protein